MTKKDNKPAKTVAELIAILQTMPQDAEVMIHDSYHEANFGIWDVGEPGKYASEDYDAAAVVLYDGD